MTTATTAILRTPLGRRVKVIERGTGTPVVLLHSGVGSAGEWKQVFSLWPEGYRLVAIEAYSDGTGPGVAGRRSLDDYVDHVYAVAEHVGASVCLVGFSWGGATALRVAAVAPELVDSLALVEPEAYALLRTQEAKRLRPDLRPARSVAGARSRGTVARSLRGVHRLLPDPARSLGGRPRAARLFSLLSGPGATYGTFCSTIASSPSTRSPR